MKSYVSYFDTQRKYKIITAYINNKAGGGGGGGDEITVSKRTLHFKICSLRISKTN